MVVHTIKSEWGESHQFEAILISIVSSWLTQATYWDPVSKIIVIRSPSKAAFTVSEFLKGLFPEQSYVIPDYFKFLSTSFVLHNYPRNHLRSRFLVFIETEVSLGKRAANCSWSRSWMPWTSCLHLPNAGSTYSCTPCSCFWFEDYKLNYIYLMPWNLPCFQEVTFG